MNYVEQLLSPSSCVLISAFASLVVIPVGIASCAVNQEKEKHMKIKTFFLVKS